MLARLHLPRQITAASSNTACLIGLVVFVRPPLTLVARRVLECTLPRLLRGYLIKEERIEPAPKIWSRVTVYTLDFRVTCVQQPARAKDGQEGGFHACSRWLDFRMHTNIMFGAAGGCGRGAVKVQLFNKLTIIRNEGEGGTTALGIRSFTLRRAA